MNPKLYFLLFHILSCECAFGQRQFEIRYLGNMGIAVIHNDSAIIIDGLHDYYGDAYLPSDTSATGAMLRRQKPFSKIVAIAVTHRHGDHFDENIVTEVANVHQSALLISGNQTRSLLNAEMQKRFSLVADSATFRITQDLIIRCRRIPHTYSQRHSAIENYRIEIVWNGFRIIHFGDADTKSEAVEALAARPDVMVVPNWFFATDGALLINPLKAQKIIATHIAPDDNAPKKNEKLLGEQILFKKYGDAIKTYK